MSTFGDSIKDFFNMGSSYNDYDEYDEYDDYDSIEDEVPARPAKPEKKKVMPRQNNVPKEDSFDDIDDYEEKPARSAFAKRPTRSSKVVPMNNERNKNIKAEIYTIKPSSLEDSKEIVDSLLESKAIIVNFEGVNTDLAQRIIDNISGACCAVNGTLKRISGYIYIVAPVSIELYGDFSDSASSNNSSYSVRGNRYPY